MIADLTGRTALITGGAQGVGRAIALALAEQGADVAIGDINKATLPQTAREIEGLGRRALALEMDVTSRQSVDSAVSLIVSTWGHLDILVNNAGVTGAPGWLESGDDRDEDWHYVLAVNLLGVVNCCKAVLDHMMERRYGKIINIASTAGKPGDPLAQGASKGRGRPSGSPYAVSKAGVIRYTQTMAPGLARHNININCICPSRMVTQMGLDLARRRQIMNPVLAEMDTLELRRGDVLKVNLFGRELLPEDVGKMAAFLASEDARNITGQAINVDGGFKMV